MVTPVVASVVTSVDDACVAQLSQALAGDAVFLTPNSRLASVLRGVLDELASLQCRKDGDQNPDSAMAVWPSPVVMPFDTWAISCWESAVLAGDLPSRLLLSNMQDNLYWEQALAEAGNTTALLSSSAAAKLAQQGYSLIRQSLLDIEQHRFDFDSAIDSRAFYQWVESYCRLIDNSEYICQQDAQRQLLQLEPSANLFKTAEQTLANKPWLKPIVMVGFQAPTALQMAIANHLARSAESAPAVTQIALQKSCQRLSVDCRVDFEAEVAAAAQWSSQLIDNNPQARIAIVIHNLAQNRMQVERIFNQVFSPGSNADNEPVLAPAFNISAGVALSQASVIKVAMLISKAISQPLKIEEWVALLLSPFIGAKDNDLAVRLHLVNALYEAGEPEYRLEQIIRLLSWRNKHKAFSTAAGVFIQGLEGLNERLLRSQAGAGKRRQKTASDWLPLLRDCLQDLAWPGARTLNSDEYQQLQQFNSHCENFMQYDAIAGALSLEQAAKLFRRHCQSQIYHRETVARPNGEQHVQVLGTLEASGQTFDYLWLTGMSDRQWPMPPNAHPLIPVHLQVQYAMPAASVEQEFNYATQLSRGYLSSAADIVISYPQRLDDIETQVSPLLRELSASMDLALTTAAATAPTSPGGDKTLSLAQADDDIFEYFGDRFGCPLPVTTEDASALLPGGAGMLKDYNENPLRAYFKWRLGVRPLGEVTVGVSPLERGNILHSALEAIWQALGGQAALQDCNVAQVQALLQQSVSDACHAVLGHRFKPLSPALVELEQERIHRLLEYWLLLECQRPEFVIDAIEKPMDFTLGHHTLQMRIDRIDRLADGRQLLIDYKSGMTKAQGWYDATISEPQLPLYVMAVSAATANSEIDQYAIAFAGLKASQPGFDGIAATDSAALNINGVKPLEKLRNCEFTDWAALYAYWQQQLAQSMEEISQGRTEVDFRYYPVDQSPYKPASRLWPSQLQLEDTEL